MNQNHKPEETEFERFVRLSKKADTLGISDNMPLMEYLDRLEREIYKNKADT